MRVMKWVSLGVVCAGLAACASVPDVTSFKPGTVSVEQVRAREKPVAEWRNADGSQTLEYDGRTYRDQNVMLDFDAQGKLVAVREVISLENMELVRRAMTRAEVKRILGNPRYVSKDGLTGGDAWEWPLENWDGGPTQVVIQVLFHPAVDGVMRVSKAERRP